MAESLPTNTDGDTRFNLAVIGVECTIVDVPTDRRRWNGDPMASKEASAAMQRAVDAFQESLRNDGFPVVHTGYGVLAEEFPNAA